MESAKANEFFEEAFTEMLMRSPQFQTRLGMKTDKDKWNDISDAHAREDYEIRKRQMTTLKETIDYDKLDRSAKLSYDLFLLENQRHLDNFEYRFHNYPANQMRGTQSEVPAFLINFHRIDDVEDAQAYISRIRSSAALFDQLIENLQIRADKGVIPPRFVFPYVIDDSRNVITGAPFDDSGDDSTILADFTKKINALDIDDDAKAELLAEANEALVRSLGPAYEKLIAYVAELHERATTDDGVWKLPDGAAYYTRRLENMTTTTLTASEVHDLGLQEVARIHAEMRAIMKEVGYDGSLQEFFEFMRTDEQFYFDETEEGRQAYLDGAVEIIDTMKGRLDELFITKPKADLIVKAVEPFREKSAGKAFYERPAPDGSRPGTYYANLYRMSDMPTYQMEALAYHEGVPGHHMQIAIAMELENFPRFRKYARYTAYSEGWALYTEYIPKEIGFYEDPYSDFGRLAMELWRACRLVVDTGIHSKKWTREEAIDYLVENTPNPEGDAIKAIERYIVMPGQATAYKIGMIKIIELRENARAKLGDDFDIREFHDTVLTNGPVPLTILETTVDEWVASKAGTAAGSR